MEKSEDGIVYRAVVNGEEQYSIWPADKELPAGWSEAGAEGSREECLDHIERVWVDMRPKSLRMEMDEDGSRGS
jgi:MbtH protein